MLGSLILYLKGMRIMMFQLSGFYCRVSVYTTMIYNITMELGPQNTMIRMVLVPLKEPSKGEPWPSSTAHGSSTH